MAFFSKTCTSCPARASCCAQARPAGPEPTTATFLPVLCGGKLGRHPAVGPGAIDDGAFDRLDRHRRVVEVERAGGFARRGADAAGEFGEIIGRMQIARGLLPVGAIDEIVPVRDLVVDRAAVVAKGNAAIHAACGLILRRLLRQRDHEFLVVADSVGRRRIAPVAPVDLEKSRYLAHAFTLRREPVARRASHRVKTPRFSRHSAASAARLAFSSSMARRYSTGITLRNFGLVLVPVARGSGARARSP